MTKDRLIQIETSPEALAIASVKEKLTHLTGLEPIAVKDLQEQAPDAHWMLIRGDRESIARCSLWWNHTPSYPGHRIGAIGHYAVANAEAAKQILEHACKELGDRGCTMAVGPMDGNTWRRYRFITDRGTEPLFFLEPDNPDEWPNHFIAQGFIEIAQYSSAVNSDLSQVDPRIERVSDRLSHLGIQIRNLNIDRFEAELHNLYQVAIISFRNNFLYVPISETEFIAQYSKIRPYIRPEFVLMAEREGELVGFLFGVPDWLQLGRDAAIDTVIVKTVAVLPGKLYAGLGNLLVSKCQEAAKEMGYTRAIHALMHDANSSRNLSDRYAQSIRGYTLFSKLIEPQ